MARLVYNNSLGTLGASLSNSGTTITFTSAPSWATISGSDYIPLILEPPLTWGPSANFEVVYVTAYTSGQTTATISRGKEGTSGVAHASGVDWVSSPLALDAVGTSGSPVNPVTSASATRPNLPVVYWQTSAQPTNLAAGDIWIKYP